MKLAFYSYLIRIVKEKTVDKVRFDFGKINTNIIRYAGQNVEVTPYFSYEEMKTLAHTYVMELISKSDTIGGNIISAELSLMSNVLDLKTSIQIFDGDVPCFTIDQLLANMDLYNQVTESIVNYKMFRELLKKVVDEIKFNERINASLGNSLLTITNKITSVLDEFASFEPTDENVARVKEMVEIVSNSPIADAITIFKNGESTSNQKSKKASRKQKLD